MGHNIHQDQGSEDDLGAEGDSSGMSKVDEYGWLGLVMVGTYVAVTSMMKGNSTA